MVDFGLARAAHGPLRPDTPEPEPEPAVSSPLGQRLTVAGTIMGTPSYMSPEQHRGAESDARTDQFSFCCALYEALFGVLPFAGETQAELAQNVLAGLVRRPPPTELPAGIEQALRRGLAVDPGARFPSMRELLDRLAALSSPTADSPAAQRTRRAFASAIGIATLALSLYLGIALRHRPPTMQQMLSLSLGLELFVLATTLFIRRRLAGRPAEREMIFFYNLALTHITAARGLAYLAGLSWTQFFPLDELALAAYLAILAYRQMPRFGYMSALLAGASLVSLRAPELGMLIGNVLYGSIAVLGLYTWSERQDLHSLPETRPDC